MGFLWEKKQCTHPTANGLVVGCELRRSFKGNSISLALDPAMLHRRLDPISDPGESRHGYYLSGGTLTMGKEKEEKKFPFSGFVQISDLDIGRKILANENSHEFCSWIVISNF